MLSSKAIRVVLNRPLISGLGKNGSNRLGVGPMQVQVATMKATHGEKYPYSEPWPYETKQFALRHELFDSTIGRFNENTKVIVVEGNVAVGKHEFARRLANEFDLKVFDGITHDKQFMFNGYDVRQLDELLPPGARSYDLNSFLADPKPQSGRAGIFQLPWFMTKYHHYMKALNHLLNTGQGVVIVRSPFSDNVFVEAMRRNGWLTKNFVTYYNEIRKASVREILRPHLTIYLDAPVNTIRERIKSRNNPNEISSANLTDQYLQSIETAHKEKFLPEMRTTGEVLEIDWTEVADNMDMELIAEEIGLLELESEDNEDPKFRDWTILDEEELCYLRRMYADWDQVEHLFKTATPYDCPEILMNHEDATAYQKTVLDHPAVMYDKGWAREFGHNVLLKI